MRTCSVNSGVEELETISKELLETAELLEIDEDEALVLVPSTEELDETEELLESDDDDFAKLLESDDDNFAELLETAELSADDMGGSLEELEDSVSIFFMLEEDTALDDDVSSLSTVQLFSRQM